jgi:hypothetical protein
VNLIESLDFVQYIPFKQTHGRVKSERKQRITGYATGLRIWIVYCGRRTGTRRTVALLIHEALHVHLWGWSTNTQGGWLAALKSKYGQTSWWRDIADEVNNKYKDTGYIPEELLIRVVCHCIEYRLAFNTGECSDHVISGVLQDLHVLKPHKRHFKKYVNAAIKCLSKANMNFIPTHKSWLIDCPGVYFKAL